MKVDVDACAVALRALPVPPGKNKVAVALRARRRC
jgi:hypothetical protein